ncbi:NAD(P)-dependent oxidoreductase [Halobacteria archaeon HArc-gm2]|nr:NAD(P)-dependent oxidoreductase [Halobacteria archaeon HArc-gm2]
MDVLVTGAYGRCGTALIDHLHDDDAYDFTYYNRSDRPDDHPYGGYDTVVGDVADEEKLRAASEGRDAMVHMAAFPQPEGDWSDVFEPNVVGTYNALEAARREEIETVVFLSSNHVVGNYEREFAPELYHGEYDFVLDHTDPVRPDSFYGATKSFGEDLGRYYVEAYDYPKRFYALRTGTVNMPAYDHPYGNAESGVDDGEWERDSEAYEREVARMKCTWQSRRDFAHQVECCLADDGVEYGIFFGVSDNQNRWFDLEHARAAIGYDPQDAGHEWDGPPG